MTPIRNGRGLSPDPPLGRRAAIAARAASTMSVTYPHPFQVPAIPDLHLRRDQSKQSDAQGLLSPGRKEHVPLQQDMRTGNREFAAEHGDIGAKYWKAGAGNGMRNAGSP